MRQGDRGSFSFLVRYIAHACVSGTFREKGFARNLGGILKRPMNFAGDGDGDIDMSAARQ